MSFGCCLVSSQSRQTFFAPRFCSGRDPPHRELLGKRQIEESIGLGNQIGDNRARHAMSRHGEKADLLAGACDLTRDLEARGGGYLRLPHRRDVDNRKVVAHLADAMRWCKSMPERGKHFEALRIPTTAWAALAASPGVTSLPNAP